MHLDVVQPDLLLQSTVTVSQGEKEYAEGKLAEQARRRDLNLHEDKRLAIVRVLEPVGQLEGGLDPKLGQGDHCSN